MSLYVKVCSVTKNNTWLGLFHLAFIYTSKVLCKYMTSIWWTVWQSHVFLHVSSHYLKTVWVLFTGRLKLSKESKSLVEWGSMFIWLFKKERKVPDRLQGLSVFMWQSWQCLVCFCKPKERVFSSDSWRFGVDLLAVRYTLSTVFLVYICLPFGKCMTVKSLVSLATSTQSIAL